MSFTVALDIKKTFEVNCSFDKVFNVLSDVPLSVSHFPNVSNLISMGGNKFHWEMEKMGAASYFVQIIYACEYISDKEAGTVKWTPIEGIGNSMIYGSWRLKGNDKKVDIELINKGTITLSLPIFSKMIVSPFAAKKYEGLCDKYIENLKKTFNAAGD